MGHSSRSSHASAPKNITWWIGLILAVMGIIFHFVNVQLLSKFSFWFVAAPAALLLIVTQFKEL